ncbi:Transposable element Tc3 [Brachionus plicatilis]|uniref:Transposable element Tc3 n=1 Tax=Brachionus plicatilis TaxID=10195 RepID=A0A3M7QWZ2_BRAPC|nr:Transposable element Tc3 [Brachionus plicatilis]
MRRQLASDSSSKFSNNVRIYFNDSAILHSFQLQSGYTFLHTKKRRIFGLLVFTLFNLQNSGGSVGIWGCINQKGAYCCSIFTGRINQFVYMDPLENQLLPSAPIFFDQSQHWIFQQDGASSHNDHSVRDWFQEKQISVLPWCPRSPDLISIENLWSNIDHKMPRGYPETKLAHTKTQLVDIIFNKNTLATSD